MGETPATEIIPHPGRGYPLRANLGPALFALLLLSPAALFAVGYRPYVATIYFAALAAFVLVACPRAAFFVFLASLSVYYPVRVGFMMVNPGDIGALLLAIAAALDYLLNVRSGIRPSRYDLPFLGLIVATLLSIPLAYDHSYCATPALRIMVIYFAFRMAYKMGVEIGVRRIVQFYICMVFVLSLANVVVFVQAGGQQRVFGPALLAFEAIAMTALPMAAAFVIWARGRGERFTYGVVCVVIALAILATQSRGPLLGAALGLTGLAFYALRKVKRETGRGLLPTFTKLLVPISVLAVVAIVYGGTIFEHTFARVAELLRSALNPEGTVALRIVLWTGAIKAFLVNPVTGIGIGNYRILDQIIPEMRMVPVWYYIGGMSAHNVILHYLAETGLIGALSLLWLSVRGLTDNIRAFRIRLSQRDTQTSGALLAGMLVFFVTIFFMRAWTWGQDGFLMAILFGLSAAWQWGNAGERAASGQ